MVSSNSLQVNDMTTVATSSNDQNDLSSNLASTNVTTMRPTTTSQAPFRFTPTGLQDILTRNLRGLVRLFNIEWQDALNVSFYYCNFLDIFMKLLFNNFIIIIMNLLTFQQSDISVREFQRNLGNQVGGFLQDNPNAF